MKKLTKESFLAGAKFKHKSSPSFVYGYDKSHGEISKRFITNFSINAYYPAIYGKESFHITHYAFGVTSEHQIFFNECTLYEDED